MTDFPLELDAGLTDRFARALDAERKVARAVAALGEVADRDVLLVDGVTTLAGQLRELGARVVAVSSVEHQVASAGNGAADVVVAAWSPVTVATDDELAEAVRLTRPGGRLLAVHEYGRGDRARARGGDAWRGPGAGRIGRPTASGAGATVPSSQAGSGSG